MTPKFFKSPDDIAKEMMQGYFLWIQGQERDLKIDPVKTISNKQALNAFIAGAGLALMQEGYSKKFMSEASELFLEKITS